MAGSRIVTGSSAVNRRGGSYGQNVRFESDISVEYCGCGDSRKVATRQSASTMRFKDAFQAVALSFPLWPEKAA